MPKVTTQFNGKTVDVVEHGDDGNVRIFFTDNTTLVVEDSSAGEYGLTVKMGTYNENAVRWNDAREEA